MPILQTRGAMSLCGFATYGAKQGASGSFGLFITPATASPVMRYDFVTNATSVATNLGIPEQYYGAAAGNAVQAIIYVGGARAPFNTTRKYLFASTSVTAGSNLTTSLSAGTAFGTATQSIAVLAFNAATTNKYIYSTDTVSLGTNLTAGTVYTGSVSNINFGISQTGRSGAGLNNKYVYAGDVVTSQPAFRVADQGTGASIATTGLMGFVASGATNLYDFASDVISSGPTMGLAVGSSCGGDTVAVFAGSSSSATRVYTWASGVFVSGTVLPGFGVGSVAVSNGVTGINV
jgi:hypothetical protein